MKVTLVQPKYFNIWESIGLGYIAAYCKARFSGNITFNFFQAFFDTDQQIIEGASDSDIVAFSCTSPTFLHALQLAREIKRRNPRIRTVFGGFHVSALSQQIDNPEVDQMVVGEGEVAFLDILNGNKDRIVQGQAIGFEELPFPDRQLIRNERELALCNQMVGKRITSFQSNRVCPFQCTFCAERTVTGVFNRRSNPVRRRDPDDLLDEIEWTHKKYHLDMFKFCDATWNVSVDHVISFCQRKLERGLALPWECNVHAGLATREMFSWMKKAGCQQINVGCESGSPKILKSIRKGITVESVAQVFDWARDIGLDRRGYFLIGYPDETLEDIKLTEKLVQRIDPEVFGVTILCPYPGTALYEHDKFKDIAWNETDEYSNDFWETEFFSNAELKGWQDRLAERFEEKLVWHNKEIKKKREAKLG
jgi:anaerobic magnesium-protoporphyrin IX monomethyl ester cyclase